MRRIVLVLLLISLILIPVQDIYAGSPVAAYPVVPSIRGTVYSHLRQIVRVGKKLGNRLNVFSKVGDSITFSPWFLTPVGNGGLRIGEYADLQPTVDFFNQTQARTNNSFANDSLAARGAWTTAEVLNPASADPAVCSAGESPLQCEYRLTKPAVALIMFGANDIDRVPLEQFEANLRTIVQITERNGVIPVLSTTLDRFDRAELSARVEGFNLAIIRVARAYRIPLWNYWLAASGLPNGGLDPTDNLHPSMPYDGNAAIFDADHLRAGMTMRNLTALQVLRALHLTVLK